MRKQIISLTVAIAATTIQTLDVAVAQAPAAATPIPAPTPIVVAPAVPPPPATTSPVRLVPTLRAPGVSTNPALPSKPGIRFDTRADWRNLPGYDNSQNVEQQGFSQFEIFRARLAFTGLLADNLIGAIRLDFLRDASLNKDNTDNILNWAFMRQRISDIFAIYAGKIWLFVGGIERLYSGADLYFVSLGAEGQRQNLTGVAFDYAHAAENVLTAFVVNNDDITVEDQKKLGSGLTYRGAFFNDKILVMGNYTWTYNGTRGTERQRRLSAGGFHIKPIPMLGFDFGYINNTDEDIAPRTDRVTSSFVTQAKYISGHWTPWVKGELSTFKNGDSSTSFERMRVGIALEYKPDVERYFRYHAAWIYISDKFDDATVLNQRVNRQEFLLGMRMVVDIL